MSRPLRVLLDGGAFFEGPRWHEGRWWVSDFYRRVVVAVDSNGRDEKMLIVDGQPSGLGWLPDGSLLVVSMKDRRLLRRSPTGELSVHAEVGRFCGGHLNDLVVDKQGRAFAGNFGFDLRAREEPKPASLVRVDPDGSTSLAAGDLLFPNGMVITGDGRTLIVGETYGRRYVAFTITDDGSLAARRVWAEVPDIAPDGCALDAQRPHLVRRRTRQPLLSPRGRGRDRRGDPRSRGPAVLRLHARRRRRADAPSLRGARLLRMATESGPGRCAPHHDGRRPAQPDCPRPARTRPARRG